jgi:hypothetical protein
MAILPEVKTDVRVNSLTGYCPFCVIHEGLEPRERLQSLTREVQAVPSLPPDFLVFRRGAKAMTPPHPETSAGITCPACGVSQ